MCGESGFPPPPRFLFCFSFQRRGVETSLHIEAALLVMFTLPQDHTRAKLYELFKNAKRPPASSSIRAVEFTNALHHKQGIVHTVLYTGRKFAVRLCCSVSPVRCLSEHNLAVLIPLLHWVRWSAMWSVLTYLLISYLLTYLAHCPLSHGRGHRLALENRTAVRHIQLTVNLLRSDKYS